MIVINSTSALEALAYDKPIFVYGRDIFTLKEICWEDVRDPKEFAVKMCSARNFERAIKFLTILKTRQVNRLECLSRNDEYIDRHYWNTILYKDTRGFFRLLSSVISKVFLTKRGKASPKLGI